MARQRRTYTREYKVEAVKLVTEKGQSVAEAARSLGIGEALLRSWKEALAKGPEQAFPGQGNRTALDDEMLRCAHADAWFLHCLPAHRGEEVAASVIDGPRSAVWQQAANRVHAARAVLTHLVGTFAV